MTNETAYQHTQRAPLCLVLYILAIALIVLAFVLRKSLTEPPAKAAEVRPFKIRTLDGKEVNFPGDYKGKLVILDFWATWCGPCMQEVPGLANAYQEFHPKGLEILGFSLDKPDAGDAVKKVMAEKHMTWDMCLSNKGFQGDIPELYGIEFIPKAFLVDGDTGKIITDAGGALRGENLRPTLEAAFKRKARATLILWALAILGLLLLVLASAFHHLTVKDQGDGLSIRFGPLPLLRRRVKYQDVVGVEVGRTTLLDGWGIHPSMKGGWVWNIWGRDCVVVRLKKGRVLRIGTDDTENLARFLTERSRLES